MKNPLLKRMIETYQEEVNLQVRSPKDIILPPSKEELLRRRVIAEVLTLVLRDLNKLKESEFE